MQNSTIRFRFLNVLSVCAVLLGSLCFTVQAQDAAAERDDERVLYIDPVTGKRDYIEPFLLQPLSTSQPDMTVSRASSFPVPMNRYGTLGDGRSSPRLLADTTITFTSTDTTAIRDLTVSRDTIIVSINPLLGINPVLVDLNMTTFITHTFASDIDMTLMSPAGTIVTITTDNGSGNDNVFNGTYWDDDADTTGQVPYTSNTGLVTDNPYVNLTTATPLVPEEAFGAFVGESPNGMWILSVYDDAGADTGRVSQWSLHLAVRANPPTTSTASFTDSTPVVIPTGPAVVADTILASGLYDVLYDLNMTTFITHTNNSNLDITLKSPAGTIVTITTDNGGTNDNGYNGTYWDDDADTTGQVPYTNNDGLVTDALYGNLITETPLVPEEAMGAFIGENPNGEWILTISDDAAVDGGTLNSWSLHFTTVLPPNEPVISVTPNALDFGSVEVGDSAMLSVLVQNVGLVTLTVDSITITNPNFSASPDSFVLAYQEMQLVNVTFTAPQPGGTTEIGTLNFVSNDTTPPTVSLTGRSGVPHIALRPDTMSFSRLATSDTTAQVMHVVNTGTDTLYYQLTKGVLPSALASMQRSVEQQPFHQSPKGAPDSYKGPAPLLGSGGPDAFGYGWIDSDEPDGPLFNWTDITGVGTQIVNIFDDDNVGPFPIGFAFPFYGNIYSDIRFCTNGFVSFTSTDAAFDNTNIPTVAQPNDALYAFWDDLNFTVSGTAHYYYDAANNQFIVQYSNVPFFSGPGTNTFQIILKPNGDIRYQYLSMTGVVNSSTVGIENFGGTIALPIAFNANYVHDSLAVLIRNVSWLSTDPTQGTVAPADSQAVQVRIHPFGLFPGQYAALLEASGNSPDIARANVSLTVLVPPPPVISGVARNTRVPNAGDSVIVTATIRDTIGISSAFVLYAIDSVGQPPIPMVRTSGTPQNGTYEGVIPGGANADGYRIEYQIQANSAGGVSATTAISAANSYFAGISPLSLTGVKAMFPSRQIRYRNYYARVTGTINGPNYQTTNTSYFMQDAVGGIDLFYFGAPVQVLNLGDSITVIGKIDQFRGLTEIIPDDPALDIVVVATGRSVPIIDLTVSDFALDPETYESMLIRFTHLFRRGPTPAWPPGGSSANIVMKQVSPTDTVIMRIDSDTEIDGSPEPVYPIRAAGIAAQNTTTTLIYDNGYQIQPRYLSDIQSTLIALAAAFDSASATVNLSWSTPPFRITPDGKTGDISAGEGAQSAVTGRSVDLGDPFDFVPIQKHRDFAQGNVGSDGIPNLLLGKPMKWQMNDLRIASDQSINVGQDSYPVLPNPDVVGQKSFLTNEQGRNSVIPPGGQFVSQHEITPELLEALLGTPITRYDIYRAVGGGAFALIDTAAAIATSYTDISVQAVLYRYYIVAQFVNGLMVPSDTVSVDVPFARESRMSLNHTPGNLTMGIFNEGSIGAENESFTGPGVTWRGLNGLFVGGPIFGTSGAGSVNGLIGSFGVFGDILNLYSNFAGGFTSDANFNQITWAVLNDSGAPSPYGVQIVQYSYTNTGEEFAFIRYGFVNTTGAPITGFHAGITIDWDVAEYFTNSGGYDTARTLVYNFDAVGPTYYYGMAALDGLSGARTTTATPTPTFRQGSFTWITTFDLTIPVNGDFRSWIGTGPMDIPVGDTAWTTFAISAGDSLGELVVHIDSATAKAVALGWIPPLPVSVDERSLTIPQRFALEQNYPNPFNPTTQIQYALPRESFVTLRVYNILGQEVARLVDADQMAGYHTVVWDGRNSSSGGTVGSGIYFYRIEAKAKDGGDTFVEVKKMLLLK